MNVQITVLDGETVIAQYVMDYYDTQQRRVLGEQIHHAMEAGQTVISTPEKRE